MRYTFQTAQWVPRPVELVFAFFISPQNLPPLMPRWQKARIEEARLLSPPPGPPSAYRLRGAAAGQGSNITLSFRPFPLSPLRIPWESTITDFSWNEFFCDAQEQGRGPFAFWLHCHRFAAETRDGVAGATITDEIEYEPPFGAVGELAHALILRQIKTVFDFRQRRISEILGPNAPHAKPTPAADGA